MEVFVDALEHAAAVDPLAYRLSLLAGAPRLSAVLRLAAGKANCSVGPTGKGRGLGIAAHESFGSDVAMVADITAEDAKVTVNRIVAAVDAASP